MREIVGRTLTSAAEYAAGKALWEATRLVRFRVQDPNGHFVMAADALEDGYSLLAYSNHRTEYDPALIARFVDRYIASIRRLTMIAGLKHYDPNRPESKKHIREATRLVQERTDLGVILVVQDYDKGNYAEPSPVTGNKTVKIFNSRAYVRAVKVLRDPGNVLFIAPEGTRSETGQMGEAEVGLDSLLEISGEKTLAMAIAIDSNPSPFKKVNVRPGKPFSINELDEEHALRPEVTRKKLMMVKIAELLSPQDQGQYGQFIPVA